MERLPGISEALPGPCHLPASHPGPPLCLQVLPIIVFFSCVMSILYHVGLMQWLILKVSPNAVAWARDTCPRGSHSPRRPCSRGSNPSPTPSPFSNLLLTKHLFTDSVVMILGRNGTTIQGNLCGREVCRTEGALRRNVRGKHNSYQKILRDWSRGPHWPDLAGVNAKSCAYYHKICHTKPGCRRQHCTGQKILSF